MVGDLEHLWWWQEQRGLAGKALMGSTSSSLAVLSGERRKRVISIAAMITLHWPVSVTVPSYTLLAA